MGQTDRILDYMKRHDGITSFEAFTECGVTRLSARIYDLRKRGYSIANKAVKDKNRYGEDIFYDRYVLEDGDLDGQR